VHYLSRLLSVACALSVPVTFCCLCTVYTGYFLLPVHCLYPLLSVACALSVPVISVACALFVPVTFCCLCTVCTCYFLLPVHCLYRLLSVACELSVPVMSVACALFVPVTFRCLSNWQELDSKDQIKNGWIWYWMTAVHGFSPGFRLGGNRDERRGKTSPPPLNFFRPITIALRSIHVYSRVRRS